MLRSKVPGGTVLDKRLIADCAGAEPSLVLCWKTAPFTGFTLWPTNFPGMVTKETFSFTRERRKAASEWPTKLLPLVSKPVTRVPFPVVSARSLAPLKANRWCVALTYAVSQRTSWRAVANMLQLCASFARTFAWLARRNAVNTRRTTTLSAPKRASAVRTSAAELPSSNSAVEILLVKQ